jgi:hypothetical protein
VSKPKCRIVVEEGPRGVKTLSLYDPNSGRTAPAGQTTEREIQKRVEHIAQQARNGGNEVDVVTRERR